MTMFRLKYLGIALLLFAALIASPQSAPAQSTARPPFSPAAFTDPEALQGEPRELTYELFEEDLPAGVVLISLAEYDGLFDVSLNQLSQVLTDFDNYEDFVPRATRSNGLLLTQTGEGPDSWLQELTLSFRVLFFGETYDYILRLDEVDLDTAGSYGLEYRLERSLDGKFQDVHGSWYLEEMQIAGEQLTYVRNWIKTEFAEDSFGLDTALRWFGPRDVRANIMAFIEEAQRRSLEGAESDG
jgi:hypothetical protein